MELIELRTESRTDSGKGVSRKLRADGNIPGILYGPKTEPIMLAVNVKALEQALKQGKIGRMLLNLTIQNGAETTRPAMIRELQVHPISRDFIHVDFYEVDMEQKIRVRVPVVIKGKSVGVELGGILQIIRRELEVLCYPTEIPEKIELDITELDIGQSIHVEDIQAEGNIEIPADVNFTVITILAAKGKDEEEEVEGEEEEIDGEPGESEATEE